MRHTRLNLSRLRAFALSLAVLFTSLPATVCAQQAPRRAAAANAQRRTDAAPAAAAKRPRLVLLIVVDQFRYDYLERFGDLFAANGLGRLVREGASWSNAHYDHIPTETAPGHATLMTGAWPAETGIIGNEWYDRDEGRRVLNAADESVRVIGGMDKEPGASPRRLLVSTLGDELRLMSVGRSKVVGVSLKDRGAILPAGRHANAAYWFSSAGGRMVSSTYYFDALPAWVARFNDARPADKYFGARWERLLPNEAEYLRRAGPDDAPWENFSKDKDTLTFPHVITGGAAAPGREFYEAISYSPYANDIVLDFAKEALANEALGADDDTDVLSVSFSANDYVGHRFGPYSQEVMDISLRTDRQIGALLDFVDQRVGLRNTVVAFSADHGVAPIPEHAARLGLPGLRIKPDDILNAVKNAFRARYGRGGERNTDEYVLSYTPKNGQIYFNPVALARDGVSREELERVAGEAALTVPGVARYFTRTQLEQRGVSPSDPVARRVLHGFHPRRGGDLVVVEEPFRLVVTYTADHFSPYSYDTHVPLIIMGNQVAPGRYEQAAAPSDLAPTLAALLRVQPPSNSVGRVLSEAFKR